MGMMQRVGSYLERAFATGPALIDPGIATFGVDNTVYQPPSYVNYPATSNAVYTCMRLRAASMASLPIRLYTVDANGDETLVERHDALGLMRKVNSFWTFRRLMSMTSQSLDVWGECFWAIERRGSRPAELWWMRADLVTVHPDPTNYIRGFTYEVNGQRIFFPREDVVWLRYENVADEFSGLSPLAAARLAADTANAAGHSNYNIFRNGMQIAGVVSPNGSTSAPLTTEQITDLQGQFDKRFRGTGNAHKVAILKFGVDFKTLSLTPDDMQFLEQMQWSLKDVARAYRVPPDKIGGGSTFENMEHAERQFWSDGILPDLTMIADEITEQLLSQFPGNLIARFDDRNIDVLHESETAEWERVSGKLDRGVYTINQARELEGHDPVPWGDVAWMDSTKMPIDSPEKPTSPIPPALASGDEPEPDDSERGQRAHGRIFAYGSPAHEAHWERQLDRQEGWERRVGAATSEQMRAQQQSILARLRDGERTRAIETVAMDPFDRGRFIKQFRVGLRPVISEVVGEAGNLSAGDLPIDIAFDVQDPNVLSAIERQVQRFAVEVTETTWTAVRSTVREGIGAGEDIDAIAARIESTMGDRIRSSGETIARTEVTTAANQGTQASWRQSGVVTGKQWIAALDARTRQTHVAAHGQTVGMDEDFHVGSAMGPHPGAMSSARESVNCRCSMVPVLDAEAT